MHKPRSEISGRKPLILHTLLALDPRHSLDRVTVGSRKLESRVTYAFGTKARLDSRCVASVTALRPIIHEHLDVDESRTYRQTCVGRICGECCTSRCETFTLVRIRSNEWENCLLEPIVPKPTADTSVASQDLTHLAMASLSQEAKDSERDSFVKNYPTVTLKCLSSLDSNSFGQICVATP